VRDRHQVGRFVCIDVGHRRGMAERYDEEVTAVHRLDVHERRAPVVAMHEGRGQLAREHATENAARIRGAHGAVMDR
jgi:hypothetical protein